MPIYTRTGDSGSTQLGSTRIFKGSSAIQALGVLDELDAAIGIVASKISSDTAKCDAVQRIQAILYVIRTLMHNPESKFSTEIDMEAQVKSLETEIDRMDEELPALTDFILQGGGGGAAECHFARCVCRRAEQVLWNTNDAVPLYFTYINRLSDYLFTLARYINNLHGSKEICLHQPLSNLRFCKSCTGVLCTCIAVAYASCSVIRWAKTPSAVLWSRVMQGHTMVLVGCEGHPM
eukprot:2712032-Rhodomonas_salina.1